MKVIWKQSLYKVIIWLAAEVILNCVGLDDLADYSEFIFERNTIDFERNYGSVAKLRDKGKKSR